MRLGASCGVLARSGGRAKRPASPWVFFWKEWMSGRGGKPGGGSGVRAKQREPRWLRQGRRVEGASRGPSRAGGVRGRAAPSAGDAWPAWSSGGGGGGWTPNSPLVHQHAGGVGRLEAAAEEAGPVQPCCRRKPQRCSAGRPHTMRPGRGAGFGSPEERFVLRAVTVDLGSWQELSGALAPWS